MAQVIITARKRSLGQGNIFSSVCQEFCSRGGVCLSTCWDTPPWDQASPRADTPRDQAPPGADPLGPGTSPRANPPGTRHPPCAVHAGRYGQQAGSMHPTGMQSCLILKLKHYYPCSLNKTFFRNFLFV